MDVRAFGSCTSAPKSLFFQDFEGFTEVFAPGRPGYPRGRLPDIRPRNLLFGLLFVFEKGRPNFHGICVSSVSPHVNHKHADKGLKRVMFHTTNRTMEGEGVAPAIKGAKEMHQASPFNKQTCFQKA